MACDGRVSSTAAEFALKEAGFVVSEPCLSRPCCFNLAARRAESLIFVRVQHDIGCLTTSDSAELKTISESFSAPCLVIGEEAREKHLQDDTVYTRHGILSINQKTFENAIVHDVPPLIQANPGGYYVEIDGEALKRRRQELGLSAGEVAEMVRTSRRTIYGYERGMAKASVTAAYNLIWSLGIPVARSVNILSKPVPERKSCVFETARVMLARNRILGRLFRRFAQYRVTAVKRAPFDFVINDPEKKLRIIGGIANRKELTLDTRVDEILSLSRITRAHPILITDDQQVEKDIQCFSSEDVSRIRNPEDFIANVT